MEYTFPKIVGTILLVINAVFFVLGVSLALV